MAKYANVCALSPYPLEVKIQEKPVEIVERMKTHWERLINQIAPSHPDLIVLPEMCDRPVFTDAADPQQLKEAQRTYLEARGEQLLAFFSAIASKYQCYIAYSAAKLMPDGSKMNCTQMLDRSGKVIETYIKNFTTVGEINAGLTIGTDIPVVECDFGRVVMIICYDMIFDEMRARVAELKPDLIVFSSLGHYGVMANYWAFSSRAYLVSSVARVASEIISPLGDVVATSSDYCDHVVARINLDYAVVQKFAHKTRASRFEEIKQKFGDQAKFEFSSHSKLNSFLLSCESDENSVEDIIKECNIETLDAVLDLNREARNQRLAEQEEEQIEPRK